ncbi:T-cell immunomodulatory protein-like isoform X2 [Tigriopus californicus]|nr:T-cell immunomodulatory protein-like isoform X2 [Tigriopus californicus]
MSPASGVPERRGPCGLTRPPFALRWMLMVGLELGFMMSWPSAVQAAELRNVSSMVFGGDLGWLPMAFGDFNADKLTDLVVIPAARPRSTLAVLLARAQTFSLLEEDYFAPDPAQHHLACHVPEWHIMGVTPGDFDGDGGMDLLVLAQPAPGSPGLGGSVSTALLFWGDHDQIRHEHRLTCGNASAWTLPMEQEPLLLDANGDDIADLYGAVNGTRGVWLFNGQREEPPTWQVWDRRPSELTRRPHSNAFVDLNSDGNADLFVTNEKSLELWENLGHGQAKTPSADADQTITSPFRKHKSVPLPACDTSKGTCIGQSVFADFDLDGRLDMIFPVCYDAECRTSTLHFATLDALWSGTRQDFLVIPTTLGQWKFDYADDDNPDNPYYGLSPRVGDINLDGYPDLLIRVQHRTSKEAQVHLLLNVFDPNSPTENKRGFLLQPDVMTGLNQTVMAAFYDLYENGLEDIITVTSESPNGMKLGAFTNQTQDSDAYFVKVIVLSGLCYHDCKDEHIQVPYGTNLPGQTICYRQQRPGSESFVEVRSCAPQLTQTAHHALQLPYTIFGLGMAPNFLDYMYVNVTNTSSHSMGRTWTQI